MILGYQTRLITLSPWWQRTWLFPGNVLHVFHPPPLSWKHLKTSKWKVSDRLALLALRGSVCVNVCEAVEAKLKSSHTTLLWCNSKSIWCSPVVWGSGPPTNCMTRAVQCRASSAWNKLPTSHQNHIFFQKATETESDESHQPLCVCSCFIYRLQIFIVHFCFLSLFFALLNFLFFKLLSFLLLTCVHFVETDVDPNKD